MEMIVREYPKLSVCGLAHPVSVAPDFQIKECVYRWNYYVRREAHHGVSLTNLQF